MRIPNATYRLQLNKDFGFRQAIEFVPRLAAIGITHLYLSSIFQARKGSMHGYDVTDPSRLNDEIGTPEDFEALVSELHARGMGILLDIVPNHMAASAQNPWWMDVLENGSASPYAAFFDVEWGHNTTVQDKIYLPMLGEPYAEALENQKLHLWIDERGFRLSYYDTPFPLDPATYHDIVSYRLSQLLGGLDSSQPLLHELGSFLEALERLPQRTVVEWDTLEVRRREAPRVKRELWELYSRFPRFREFVDENIRMFNGAMGDPASFDRLDSLIRKQPYELAFWRVAREKINYRRFFDVTELIGLHAEDPQVFEATHALTLKLLAEDKISALRIDHVDGLYDPPRYLVRLQQRAAEACGGQNPYIVVEKILNESEVLPDGWPVAGTTGYDFLGAVNNVFVHPEGLERLQEFYSEFTDITGIFYDVANEQKRRIMSDLFVGEMNALAYHLQFIAEQDRYGHDLSPQEIRRALVEITISMSVYRTYVRDPHIGGHDREFLGRAINDARFRNPNINESCFNFISRVLLLQFSNGLNEDALRFVMRWQQLTGPIMAKGVEDTTLYVFNRLVSMNEVGGCPEPLSIERFHAFNTDRNARWPASMSATSTHDTKRSADVRARINVLSEIPDTWMKSVRRWARLNRVHKRDVNGEPAPDANDEYLIYQTLLGAWPIEWDRLQQYLVKAMREAKVHTSWLAPNKEYEDALLAFTKDILEHSTTFFAQFETLHRRVAFYGAVNSLSQTLLKIASPGVPDFYQDTTRWSFRLVDPDNRVPPDPARAEAPRHFDPELLENWQDGRIKAWVISAALCFRKDNRELFEAGEYVPLQGFGRGADHIISFARRHGSSYVIAAVPRHASEFSALEKFPLGRRIWRDSYIILPDDAPSSWLNVLTDEPLNAALADDRKVIYVSDALRACPVALLAPQGA